ncbi:hypothetical protein [Paractinoplanes durhamensis]|uniref:Secreted protein n=1 Tax=Paractinoplanes durhamensis TaxID=113563 RepID=A0ABQ3Z6P6_9ACTN|nr:hypothetical protein [Actinoplanes durhamensis]GIE05508.1 hypothetical protein Adu01nite_68580 [Actinoplanes durhamensis]
MKRTIALALLAALALPVAVATPASAAVDCVALQAALDGYDIRITILQERLAEAGPAQKPGIIAQIKRLSALAAVIEQQLIAGNCP